MERFLTVDKDLSNFCNKLEEKNIETKDPENGNAEKVISRKTEYRKTTISNSQNFNN